MERVCGVKLEASFVRETKRGGLPQVHQAYFSKSQVLRQVVYRGVSERELGWFVMLCDKASFP